MDIILQIIDSNIYLLPLVVSIGLILGGFNVPISEDFLIITAALYSTRVSFAFALITHLCIFVFAFLSDALVYYWGTLVRKGTNLNKNNRKILTHDNVNWVSSGLKKYKVWIYIFCRFIPFGVRNALFLTTGFVKFPFKSFARYDSLAAVISTSCLFYAVYFLGKTGSLVLKIIGFTFFGIFILFITFVVLKHRKEFIKKSREEEESNSLEAM